MKTSVDILGTGFNVEDKRETAQYLSDMILELRQIAKALKMLTLQGLLDVAYYEAAGAANAVELPNGELERLEEMRRASLVA